MGFRFRRSVKILPGIRVNLSGSGASVSLGGRGFHYTIGPKGTRVTAGIPGTGLSWTEYTPHTQARPGAPNVLDPPSEFDLTHIQLQTIENASAGEINARSTSELAPILNSVSHKFRIAAFIQLLSVLLFVGALLQANQLWLGLSALYATVFVPTAIFLDRYRRSVKVIYDSQGVVARISEALALAFTELAACKSVWTIRAEGRIADWKRNAGATGQIRRTRTKLQFGKPGCIRGGATFPTFKLGSDALYLLPDSALVIVGGAVAAASYRDLDFTMPLVRFIEEDRVPSDTTIVDHTWRYVNKSGGPDRRFASNRQIPVCLYRELSLQSEGGLNCKFQFSNPAAADSLYKVIEALRRTTVELPQSITYVQAPKRWPTVVFFVSAILLSAAQLLFFKDGFRKPNNLFGAPYIRQTTPVLVQPPNSEVGGPRTGDAQSRPAQTLSPPIELKHPTPADPDRTISTADVNAREPLDLNDSQNVLWVQSRLRELGFLSGPIRGWDSFSRSALRDFKAANGLPAIDLWDLNAEELLASGTALRAEQTFIGSWSETSCEPGEKPGIFINSRRAVSSAGGVCEFLNVKSTGSGWSIATSCSNGGEKWTATIRLTMVGDKLVWTGRDKTQTQYGRCR